MPSIDAWFGKAAWLVLCNNISNSKQNAAMCCGYVEVFLQSVGWTPTRRPNRVLCCCSSLFTAEFHWETVTDLSPLWRSCCWCAVPSAVPLLSQAASRFKIWKNPRRGPGPVGHNFWMALLSHP